MQILVELLLSVVMELSSSFSHCCDAFPHEGSVRVCFGLWLEREVYGVAEAQQQLCEVAGHIVSGQEAER